MRKIIVLAAVSGLLTLTGCGHNIITYSDGIGLETTANPETFTFGLNFRYGKIFTATVKEKTDVNLEAGMSQESGTNSKTGLETKLSLKTGDQVTGYTVELEKVKAVK
jgi:hypothetical protein